jgi:hypothetical protein
LGLVVVVLDHIQHIHQVQLTALKDQMVAILYFLASHQLVAVVVRLDITQLHL